MTDFEPWGDVRDLLRALPHHFAGNHYYETDIFTVRHRLIRELTPAPRSVFEFGALVGYFLVTALDAAPSIELVGWVDDESHTPGSNAMCEANVLSVRPDVALGWDPSPDTPQPYRYDLVQVDGDHSAAGCLADLRHAALLEPRWIMVDDWDAELHQADIRAAVETFRAEQPGWSLTEHRTVNGLALLSRR